MALFMCVSVCTFIHLAITCHLSDGKGKQTSWDGAFGEQKSIKCHVAANDWPNELDR